MAKREPKRDKVVGLFDRGAQERRISNILDRAVSKRVEQTQSAFVRSRKTPNGIARSMGKKAVRTLRKAMIKALKGSLSRQGPGDTGSSRPSVRKTGADGARSFHFSYYSVSKADGYGPSTSSGLVKGAQSAGAAAAHHAYIEREAALEALYEPHGPEVGGAVGRGRTSAETMDLEAAEEKFQEELLGKAPAKGRAKEGREREPGGMEADAPGAAKAAQAYIENPVKLRNSEIVLNSFGTIGDTFEERLSFWEKLEANERKADARIQNRIICELPHQSTPQARNEILQAFVAPWRDRGVPFHVAVHAPGPENDSRNFHAHLVFSERPAKKMVDPATGKEEWDFAITETYKTASYNKRVRHPFRQDKLREFGEKGFVVGERKRFAEAVTAVMAKVDPTVKFDHRSYKAMGVDVTPMKTVSRILKDRMRQGRATVLDAGITKRMIDAELAALAQKRDADLERMLKVAGRVEALKKDFPSVGKVNRRLAPRDRIGPGASLTRKAFDAVMDKRLAIEAERMERRIVARAEEAVCERVIAATNPRKTAAALREEDPMALAAKAAIVAGLDAAGIAALHAAAREELAEIRKDVAATETRLRRAALANGEAWRKVSGSVSAMFKPAAPAPSPEPAKAPAAPTWKAPPQASVAAAPPKAPQAAIKTKPGPAKAAGKPKVAEFPFKPAPTPPDPEPAKVKAAPAAEAPRTPGGKPRTEPWIDADGKIQYPPGIMQRLDAMMKASYSSVLTGAAFVADLAERGFVVSGPETPGSASAEAKAPEAPKPSVGPERSNGRTEPYAAAASRAPTPGDGSRQAFPTPKSDLPPIVAGWGAPSPAPTAAKAAETAKVQGVATRVTPAPDEHRAEREPGAADPPAGPASPSPRRPATPAPEPKTVAAPTARPAKPAAEAASTGRAVPTSPRTEAEVPTATPMITIRPARERSRSDVVEPSAEAAPPVPGPEEAAPAESAEAVAARKKKEADRKAKRRAAFRKNSLGR